MSAIDSIPSIDQRSQLAVSFGSDLVPCRSFEFFLNGEKIEIDTLTKGNVGYHHKNPRYSFTLVIYQLGDVTPQRMVQRLNKSEQFTILLVEHDDSNGAWKLGNMQWDDAILTSIRGTGMSPDDIPTISVTAKALTLKHTEEDGTTREYGHHY